MSETPQIMHRARVVLTDSQGRGTGRHENDIQEGIDLLSGGVYLRVPVGKTVGKVETFTVTIEYLGGKEKLYKTTYAQRVKARAANERRRKKREKEEERLKLERQERELVQRRQRIMNQVELAFMKQGRDAVNFVTCDECDALATHLGLAYENPGSQIIDPEQITGAWCAQHDYKYARPYKTKAVIACSMLEFFYDGLRQICIKPTASRPA
jgi:hypothetical protein